MNEDKLLRDMLINSASHIKVSDEPTVVSLYDTVEVLKTKNANWREHEFSQSIFVWQASLFLNSHSDEVCRKECPELANLMLEYRTSQTIRGSQLGDLFGVKAVNYVFDTKKFDTICLHEKLGTSPVKDCHFEISGDQDE